ncbi:Uncharacterized protein Fot_28856 [Forsythia ovata]|uniref:Uncharacterized protein n=1 Tax=Forsythia ovata TaxID=205694 RepID=A0ABD1TQ76_9LAMI
MEIHHVSALSARTVSHFFKVDLYTCLYIIEEAKLTRALLFEKNNSDSRTWDYTTLAMLLRPLVTEHMTGKETGGSQNPSHKLMAAKKQYFLKPRNCFTSGVPGTHQLLQIVSQNIYN